MPRCLLCAREVEPIGGPYEGQALFVHPETDDCLAIVTDAWGIAIDETTIQPTPPPLDRRAMGFLNGEIVINAFSFIEDVLEKFFHQYGLPRLGGASSGRGWTSFSIYQKCPYLWKQRYARDPGGEAELISIEPTARSIGTLLHVFLALHYAAMIPDHPYRGLTPQMVKEFAIKNDGNPAFIIEAWRVWTGYRLFYMHEVIEPLAVEYDLVHPRTRESCRFDAIVFYPDDAPGRMPGTWILEHKSAARFDQATLHGWPNDGEVIGQAALWKELGLDRRFGPLQGVIVNILGKQPKELKFHRTVVSPQDWQIKQHLRDLTAWEGLIQLSRASRSFPRARQSCVGRYGMCELFDHCAGSPPRDEELVFEDAP